MQNIYPFCKFDEQTKITVFLGDQLSQDVLADICLWVQMNDLTFFSRLFKGLSH